ncbi:MAG: hypothetical protein UE699_04445 [Bacilli bacterium]|nr:hypothetical protein [Bacilli bacterium]
MENTGLSSFHFNSQRVNEGIGEMTQAKNEMTDYANSIFESTRLIRRNSLFEYCTALDQMLNELLVRTQGIAYGDALIATYKTSETETLKISDSTKREYNRVSSQYSLSDINFISVLGMLNNLKNVASEINFSSGRVFDSNASKISQSLLSDNLARMISSANNVNNNLMSLKDARIATQKARWDALTELNSKYVDSNQKTNQKTTPSVMAIPIIPVTSNEEEEKEKPSEKDNNEKKEDEKVTPIDKDKKPEKEEQTVVTNPKDDKEDKKDNNEVVIPINPTRENPTLPDRSYLKSSGQIPSNEIEIPEIANSEEPIILEPEEPSSIETEPITINTTPAVEQTKKSGINIGPVLAGVGAATAIGVGAKVYLDNKKNNDNDEDSIDEDLFSESQEDEEEQNTDEISAENWQGDDDITTDDDENFEVTLNDLGEI